MVTGPEVGPEVHPDERSQTSHCSVTCEPSAPATRARAWKLASTVEPSRNETVLEARRGPSSTRQSAGAQSGVDTSISVKDTCGGWGGLSGGGLALRAWAVTDRAPTHGPGMSRRA